MKQPYYKAQHEQFVRAAIRRSEQQREIMERPISNSVIIPNEAYVPGRITNSQEIIFGEKALRNTQDDKVYFVSKKLTDLSQNPHQAIRSGNNKKQPQYRFVTKQAGCPF